MHHLKPRQKADKTKTESRYYFGFNKSIYILALAPGVLLLLHYLSQRFLSQIYPIFLNPPNLESVSSASKALVDIRSCQSLRSAVVTIYAESEVGSGSIIDLKRYANVGTASSFVLTNSHVVLPAKDKQVNVAIESRKFVTGEVVATDLTNDLAIVKLNGEDPLRKNITLADPTNKPQAGQLACTVGNPFNRSGIITSGKVLGDRGDNDLKLNLYINPGNSGGPLVDTNGKMIGVIKSALYLPTGKNSGISFATNLASIDRFIQKNLSKIAILSQSPSSPSPSDLPIERPINFNPTASLPAASGTTSESLLPAEFWYGMDIDEDLAIILVDPDSPAEKAGLTSGDRIVAIDGTSVKSLSELQKILNQHPTSTEFTIERYQECQQHKILVNKIN